MPMFMGASKKQAQLIENLPGVFKSVLKRHNLAAGDFPDLEDFRSKLKEHEFSKFQVGSDLGLSCAVEDSRGN